MHVPYPFNNELWGTSGWQSIKCSANRFDVHQHVVIGHFHEQQDVWHEYQGKELNQVENVGKDLERFSCLGQK